MHLRQRAVSKVGLAHTSGHACRSPLQRIRPHHRRQALALRGRQPVAHTAQLIEPATTVHGQPAPAQMHEDSSCVRVDAVLRV